MSDEVATETAPEQSETVPAETPAVAAALAVTGGTDTTSLDAVIDVPLRVTVEIGSTRMLVREVLQLNKGSVVALDRMSGDPADILVNGRLIARGEITVVDDALAVRVIELIGREAASSR